MGSLIRYLPVVGPVLRLTWRLFKDRRVSMPLKILPSLAALYVLSPIDLRPDVIPVLGWIDDLVLAGLLLGLFFILSPWDVVLEHATGNRPKPDSEGQRGKSGGQQPDLRTVDGTFKYIDE